MTDQNLEISFPRHLGCQREILIAYGQDLCARLARSAEPIGQTQRQQDALQVGAQEHHDENNVQQRGNGCKDVHDAHHHHIHFSAEKSGNAAVQRADHHVHQRSHKADGQTDARTVGDAGKLVTAKHIGAQPVLSVGRLIAGGIILLLIGVGADDRAENGQQDHEEYDDKSDHRQLVSPDLHKSVLPVGNAGTVDLVRVPVLFRQRLKQFVGDVLIRHLIRRLWNGREHINFFRHGAPS